MNYDYHAIIIGAGSGGLAAAAGCAALGARTALIEARGMGGDCLNTGCVPSKTLIRAARAAAGARETARFGVDAQIRGADLAKVMPRVASVISEIAPRDSEERFRGLGVDVYRSEGRLLDAHTVKAGDRTLTARFLVVAAGSEPAVPPLPGLDSVRYYTHRDIFTLKTLPKKMLILGGGGIGLELGQAFRQLGSQVEIFDRDGFIFSADEPEVGPLMLKALEKEGIVFRLGAAIKSVKSSGGGIAVLLKQNGKALRAEGDVLLVALGRRPATAGLGLAEAGVSLDARGYIKTDARMRTSVPGVYACGDCAGPYPFTHMAGYQAGIVVRNIVLGLPARADYNNVAWATYTRPEVAHAGLTARDAAAKGLLRDTILVPLSGNDRAVIDGDPAGFLKLVTGPGGRLLGATLVAEKASEMIGAAAMAVANKLSASAFASAIFPYPTESEIFRTASFEHMKRGFKPWMKRLVRSVLLRGTAAAAPALFCIMR